MAPRGRIYSIILNLSFSAISISTFRNVIVGKDGPPLERWAGHYPRWFEFVAMRRQNEDDTAVELTASFGPFYLWATGIKVAVENVTGLVLWSNEYGAVSS
jgi:hypothetical protein